MSHAGLPVPGYKPQSDTKIALVTANKVIEERVLRILDELARGGFCDPRWLAIGRTDIEKGFSAVNRSIFTPTRVVLPDEEEPNGLELAAQWHEARAAEFEALGTEADMLQAEHHRRYAREVRDIDTKKGGSKGTAVRLTADVTTPGGAILAAGMEGVVVDLPPTVDPSRGLIAAKFPAHGTGTFLIPRENIAPVETPPPAA